MQEYNVSTKVNGKWWTFGRIKKNQYGNYQLSFKNTDALKKFVSEGGEWLNFSLFEPRDKEEGGAPKAQAKPATTLDDEIPF
jgi:hypothetical protein